MNKQEQEGPEFTGLTELASERMGGQTLVCSDDFFAEKENLLKPGRGIFIPDKYTDRGKWMDGWESRRKRTPGHDWCIIKLGVKGTVNGVDIDTNHFLGNHPPHASIDACSLGTDEEVTDWDAADWKEILKKSPLEPGSQNFYATHSNEAWTHLRLNIYPDGGVARLKVYGKPHVDWQNLAGKVIDLAAARHGGTSLSCNDMFFSSKDNIVLPGKGINMGDGWETKRNRTPGNVDWLIIQLGHKGTLDHVIVDTHHFKGNYPDACSLEGADLSGSDEEAINSAVWQEFLPKSKLQGHQEHMFDKLSKYGPYTHIKLKIYPDGGVSRLRIFGKIV